MLKRCILTICLLSQAAFAQTNKVDFQRDVLPIIRQNCIGCHGPMQQMNSFRLDRRSVAMRGGTRTVIIPGSSESSRLYLRLIGKQFGNQMPPSGPLAPEHVAIFKAWIDEGAVWPDALANEVDLPPADSKAVAMVAAIRAGETATFQKLVKEDPKSLNLRGPDGSTPFMYAVLYSDAATVAQLLELGADPNKRNDAEATALMWAATNLEKTRLLIEHGADVNARSNDGRTPLLIAATQAGTAPIVKLLLEHGANPNPPGRGAGDSSPLRDAATAGDSDVMQLLIEHGANVQAAGGGALGGAMEAGCAKCVGLLAKRLSAKEYSSALLTIAVGSDLNDVKFALDRGANVNAANDEGRTAITFAANSDRLPLDTVKLLIERGANVNAKNIDGESVLDRARLLGDSPIVDLLVKSGAKSDAATSPVLKFQKTNTIQAAVQRSLPIIQRADITFMQKSGCVSCHNESVPAMAIAVARRSGFKVDEEMASRELKAVVAFEDIWRDRLLQGVAPGGVSYTLVGLQAMGYKPDLITDAIARDIRMHQLAGGNWRPPCGGSRAPHCGTQITNTALSIRALQAYAHSADKADTEKAIQRATAWLLKTPATSTEDRTFRLLGLAFAGQDKDTIQKAMRELLSTQRADGGWSDVPALSSGAYATGSALMALNQAGLPVSDPAYQRGIQFLLKTQLEDGSWYAKSRSLAVQPYFDVGFPHGYDQWISVAATSWATMALAVGAVSDRPASSPGPR